MKPDFLGLFSISFSLIIFGGKLLYKKLTGKEISSQSHLREIMQIISPSEPSSGVSYQLSGPLPSNSGGLKSNDEESTSESSDSWKDRIRD